MVIGEREARQDLRADSGKPTRKVLEFDVATEFHHGGGLEFGPDGVFLSNGPGDPEPLVEISLKMPIAYTKV